MNFQTRLNPKGISILLIQKIEVLKDFEPLADDRERVVARLKKGQEVVVSDLPQGSFVTVCLKAAGNDFQYAENLRRKAADLLQSKFLPEQEKEVYLIDLIQEEIDWAYFFAEGLALANYQFLKYKSKPQELKNSLETIYFSRESISSKRLKELQIIIDAVYLARDLVNHPFSFLTAEQLSEEIVKMGKEGRFKVKVLDRMQIEKLGMGGLLGVNKGSVHAPTFTVLEHIPTAARKMKPLVLVGKGVVFDTGGLSLKPTPDSMDEMKSDMSGAAVVSALLYIAGMLDLPIPIVGLIPATDNRPGVDAYAPSDVLRMFSGTTVEVMNTDAEGRLILADALHYAKKYNPALVLDFATLTGAAARILGDYGIVYMGKEADSFKAVLEAAGHRQHERVGEIPFWPDFKELLHSDVADMKNIGGPYGGAITAGKFLEHFTEYPWLHLDIAGVSYHKKGKDYRPAGGTGYGVRLMADFLLRYAGR